jgi:uridine kinase
VIGSYPPASGDTPAPGNPPAAGKPSAAARPSAAGNPPLAQLVRAVSDAVPRHPPTTIVGVDGPSGSGKTTLAERLRAALAPDLAVAVLHMDDLYPGWDGLTDGVPNLLRWVLEPLAAGRPAGYRRFDWVADSFAVWHDLPPVKVLIVEGVGSGAAAVAPLLDLLWWIEAPQPVRFERGIARDGEAYRPNWERWAVQERSMFARDRTRERADVRLDGTAPIR